MLKQNNFLMEDAGDGQGGGGQAGTLLGGGGGTGANSGDAGSGGGASAGAEGNSAGNQNANGGAPADWKLALPKELQEDPSLKSITDVANLAKSYVNAQKLIGADKIVLPSKHATDDDWKAVFTKLGLPADVKDYEVKKPDNANVDDNFITKFKEAAHKSGVLPKQAQALVNWFNEANAAAMNDVRTKQAAQVAKELDGLRSEWGQAFDAKVTRARLAIQQYGDDSLKAHLDKTGLGNDVNLIKFFAKVGESFTEDEIKGTGGKFGGVKSPAEAQKEISSIMGNAEHPYHLKSHPGHDAAVQEMRSLYEMVYVNKK